MENLELKNTERKIELTQIEEEGFQSLGNKPFFDRFLERDELIEFLMNKQEDFYNPSFEDYLDEEEKKEQMQRQEEDDKMERTFVLGCPVTDYKDEDGNPINMLPSEEAFAFHKRFGSVRKRRERWNHFFNYPQKRWSKLSFELDNSDKVIALEEKISKLEERISGMQKVAENHRRNLREISRELNMMMWNEEMFSEDRMKYLLGEVVWEDDFIHYHNKYIEETQPKLEREVRNLKLRIASIELKSKAKKKSKISREDENWDKRKELPIKSQPIILNDNISTQENQDEGSQEDCNIEDEYVEETKEKSSFEIPQEDVSYYVGLDVYEMADLNGGVIFTEQTRYPNLDEYDLLTAYSYSPNPDKALPTPDDSFVHAERGLYESEIEEWGAAEDCVLLETIYPNSFSQSVYSEIESKRFMTKEEKKELARVNAWKKQRKSKLSN